MALELDRYWIISAYIVRVTRGLMQNAHTLGTHPVSAVITRLNNTSLARTHICTAGSSITHLWFRLVSGAGVTDANLNRAPSLAI